MFGLGAGELLLILVIALLFIGPKKLPELARGLGKGLREFQKAKDDLMTQIDSDDESEEHNSSPTGVKTSESSDETIMTESNKTEDQSTQEKPNENA